MADSGATNASKCFVRTSIAVAVVLFDRLLQQVQLLAVPRPHAVQQPAHLVVRQVSGLVLISLDKHGLPLVHIPTVLQRGHGGHRPCELVQRDVAVAVRVHLRPQPQALRAARGLPKGVRQQHLQLLSHNRSKRQLGKTTKAEADTERAGPRSRRHAPAC